MLLMPFYAGQYNSTKELDILMDFWMTWNEICSLKSILLGMFLSIIDSHKWPEGLNLPAFLNSRASPVLPSVLAKATLLFEIKTQLCFPFKKKKKAPEKDTLPCCLQQSYLKQKFPLILHFKNNNESRVGYLSMKQ